MGVLIRSAPREIRDTDRGLYGAGCPHVGVECMVAQINKLPMHYGCPSNDGLKLKLSLESLILELGFTDQPFQESYERYGSWVMDCWLKSLWEKCAKFDVKVIFNDISLEMPREGNKWLMLLFKEAGFSTEELKRLNRV